MKTNFNKPYRFYFLSALLLFSCQILNAQTISLQLLASDFNSYNISCFGNQDGTIDLTVTGGTAPYTFQWSNKSQTEDLSNLAAGYYHVTVTDVNSESAEAEITLTEPMAIKIELNAYKYPNGYNISQNGACNGNVSATVSGGVSPYTYHWNPGNQTISNPTNLCSGVVFAEVTDNNGCLLKENTMLFQPEKDSWLSSGNGNTVPTNQFIGTTDNKDLVMRTNNIERMRITFDGGIQMKKILLDTLRVHKIMPLPGDTVIHIGDSSITVNINNSIQWTPQGAFRGLAIGNLNTAFGFRPVGLGINSLAIGNGGVRADGNYSVAIGTDGVQSIGDNSIAIGGNIATNATNAIAIGNCSPLTGTAKYFNDKASSLGIAFNSDQPTLFVSSGSGPGYIGTGSVGIGGTNAPTQKLHVVGNAIFTKTPNAVITSAPFIRGQDFFSNSSLPDYTWAGDNGTGLFHPSYNVIAFSKGGTEAMRINSNGSVGIGTVNPSGNFEVKANGASIFITESSNGSASVNLKNSNGFWHFSGPRSSESNNPMSIFWNDFTTYHRYFSIYDNSHVRVNGVNNFSASGDEAILELGDGNNYIKSVNGYGIKIGAYGSADAIRIWNNGTVGIGIDPSIQTYSSTPYKLLVGGKVGAYEIWVQTTTTWPDYVFEKGYQLMSLDEIRNFILANQHLPGIPSAKQIEELGGVNLGEMQVSTIKNMEDIYLQLIKMNDRLKLLEAQNALLEEELAGKKANSK